MPTTEEKIARMLDKQDSRISRLENAEGEEGVPNPLLSVREVTRSSDAVAISSKATGSMQWGDSWGASEWNPSGGA